MSKESYISGFFRAAESYGVDPMLLIKTAAATVATSEGTAPTASAGDGNLDGPLDKKEQEMYDEVVKAPNTATNPSRGDWSAFHKWLKLYQNNPWTDQAGISYSDRAGKMRALGRAISSNPEFMAPLTRFLEYHGKHGVDLADGLMGGLFTPGGISNPGIPRWAQNGLYAAATNSMDKSTWQTWDRFRQAENMIPGKVAPTSVK